jgi:hypothetical protein
MRHLILRLGIFMNSLLIVLTILFVTTCRNSGKPVPKVCQPFNLIEGRLSNFIFEIPNSFFRLTKGGIEVFEPNDTSYYDLNYKAYLAEGGCIKCLIIQKEGYNNYYLLDKKILDVDATYASDSLKGEIENEMMYLYSYFSRSDLLVDTIVINRKKIIEIKYKHN